MRKIILALASAMLLLVVTAAVAFADPPTSACNGLDVAHGRIHSTGTQGELMLHSLRVANHCH